MIKNYGVEVSFSGIISLVNFIKSFGLKDDSGDRPTERKVIALAYIFPFEGKWADKLLGT
jgi:hypothetical protein